MSKKMLIDATHPEETRVVVVDGNKVEEFDFESASKRQLAGNIYLAKVTRVEPSLQAAFVDYGGNRHGFLAFSEIHPDYYQIPVADREALLAEEEALTRAEAEDEQQERPKSRRRRRRGRTAAEKTADTAETVSAPADAAPAAEAEAGAAADAGEGAEGADIAGLGVIEPDSPAPELVADFGDGEGAAESPADGDAADDGSDTDDRADDDADESADDDGGDTAADAADRDPTIESVAQEDEAEELRPRRKPRPRKYKIQEVIKVRQIMLVQVVKEERGNKGAALTTYLSLAGRYCVLMPNTARGGGISRKITNAADRKKLKEIAAEIDVPQGAGLIIRTAGAKRTKAEIKRDYEYLLRQWEQIRDLTLKSIAPAPIYEEGNLIKRSIRDLYNREIDEILIEGEKGYRVAKDYMKMLMPSHAKNVKHYTDPMPLFARYGVESTLAAMFNPTVQLPSGGYIVIGVTEALVAIDVNSGRSTREGSIEDTALKTNLEAADEIARQLRLRDLAGLIVIDFIDMEDRRNNAAVEKRIKERLKTDRARIQVGRISGFGLMEMSRQRLRPGMIEATTQPCPHCHGTGLTRSDDSLALAILREMEEEGVRQRSREVVATVPVSIANFMLNQKRDHIAMIENRYGMAIRIEGSPLLISPDYRIEKFKTASRPVPEPAAEVVSMETSLLPEGEADDTQKPAEGADEGAPRKKRRRRRRRGGRGRSSANGGTQQQAADSAAPESGDAGDAGAGPSGDQSETPPPAPAEAGQDSETGAEAQAETDARPEAEDATGPAPEPAAEKPRRKRTTRRKAARKTRAGAETGAEAPAAAADADADAGTEAAPPSDSAEGDSAGADDAAAAAPEAGEPAASTEAAPADPDPAPEPAPPAAEGADAQPGKPAPAAEPPAAPEPAPQASGDGESDASPDQAAESQEAAPRPRRRGWWARRIG